MVQCQFTENVVFFINVTDFGSYDWELWDFLTDTPGTLIPRLLSFTESGEWLSRGVTRARSTVPDLELTLGGHSWEWADTAFLEPAGISGLFTPSSVKSQDSSKLALCLFLSPPATPALRTSSSVASLRGVRCPFVLSVSRSLPVTAF